MNKMNKGLSYLALAATASLLSACQQGPGPEGATGVPETELQRESYSLGRNIGMNIASTGIELEADFFNAGFYDAINGEQRMTDEEIMQTVQALQQKTAQKQQEKIMQSSTKNLAAAEAFLAENANKDGVVALDSGLQYSVLTAAEGDKPSAEDVVTVHYEGRLLDGTVFDSSYQRGEPTTFPLNGVIEGWTEALQLMAPGAKWQLYIPPNLAYGDRPVGQLIEANSLLIFDVELISIAEQ